MEMNPEILRTIAAGITLHPSPQLKRLQDDLARFIIASYQGLSQTPGEQLCLIKYQCAYVESNAERFCSQSDLMVKDLESGDTIIVRLTLGVNKEDQL